METGAVIRGIAEDVALLLNEHEHSLVEAMEVARATSSSFTISISAKVTPLMEQGVRKLMTGISFTPKKIKAKTKERTVYEQSVIDFMAGKRTEPESPPLKSVKGGGS